MTDQSNSPSGYSHGRSLLPSAEERAKLRRWRTTKDQISKWGITAAGYGVVFSLTLIFVYLFYEVAPIIKGATVKPTADYTLPGVENGQFSRHLLLERYETLGLNYQQNAVVSFFEIEGQAIRKSVQLPVPEGATATSFANGEDIGGVVAYGFDNGEVVLAKHNYDLTFPNDLRYIEPKIEYPVSEKPIVLDSEGQAITHLAVQVTTRGNTVHMVAGYTEDGRLLAAQLQTRRNLLSGAVTVQAKQIELPALTAPPVKILIDKSLGNLFVADQAGVLHYYDISDLDNPRRIQSISVGEQQQITAIEFLVGSVSLVVGKQSGQLSQWFLVRDEANNFALEWVRSFKTHSAAITDIAPEYTRKGFVAVDASGGVGVHYGTSSRTLMLKNMSEQPLVKVAISPITSKLLLLDSNNRLIVNDMWNRHPQLSFKALWNKVWYEGRADPEYIWQSSSGSDEFESKFSLVPLTVGTLKAAFFAMLFAMPLGLMGAVYTAYFMTPKLRGKVKPTIEIMEALPTVILGFLAGLWLAPFMENNLPAVFSILLGLPVLMLLTAFAWRYVPKSIGNRIPTGWEAVILAPVILLYVWMCVSLSPIVEVAFFDGSMRQWFTNNGITYDQRNALVVGIAMGFAVIPTIYSIAEDAVFNVPKHLTQGSLALGATPWQTVVGVVLPTASPGMFSAIMIGFGRAIGETMIVLMATGNSPIVNFNIFEGMRTLSANIAVELPETAIGSSHFRILFLAALVLFVLTFVLNTIAEVVRQRLRKRYSSL